MLRYAAIVQRDGKTQTAVFPDAPGCATQADPGGRTLEDVAQEALEGWLETMLQTGQVPPEPKARRAPRGARLLWVTVPARLGAKLAVRWARQRAGLSQAELGRRAGLSQTAIARLEHPDWNPTIDQIEKVAQALGARLSVEIEAA